MINGFHVILFKYDSPVKKNLRTPLPFGTKEACVYPITGTEVLKV